MSGNDNTGGELGASESIFVVEAIVVNDNALTDGDDSETTVPVTDNFVVLALVGTSLAALCSASNLSNVLLLPMTVRRNDTVWALHVSDLVHGFPVSSFNTPQCRSGSYSRSLRSERSVLSLFLLVCPLLPGLLTGLDEAIEPLPVLVVAV